MKNRINWYVEKVMMTNNEISKEVNCLESTRND